MNFISIALGIIAAYVAIWFVVLAICGIILLLAVLSSKKHHRSLTNTWETWMGKMANWVMSLINKFVN